MLMNDPISRSCASWQSGFSRLLAWLSPGFPVGAFSYSHGLEAAVEAGAVRDRATLERWIAAILEHGSGRIDADFLRDAWRLIVDDHPPPLWGREGVGGAGQALADPVLTGPPTPTLPHKGGGRNMT